MPVHLIIDGYNLLAVMGGQARCDGPRSSSGRDNLVRDLSAYRRRKGHAVTVVFDGWHSGQLFEGREHRLGIQIIYSKRGERADQVIQRLAKEFESDCAVVSSDREVTDYARAQGAFVMEAREFAEKLLSAAVTGVAHKELDPGETYPVRRGPEKRGNPRKLPKSARRRGRQLRRF
ncbi:MAG: NYN domain-containing protein [Nitrospira sp.]|nr:NYN domain-containing protein [Nitrospira sp.]